MKIGAHAVILGLVLLGLTIAVAIHFSFSAIPAAVNQSVEQATQQAEDSPMPPKETKLSPNASDGCVESISVSLSEELEIQKCILDTTDWLNGQFILKQDDKERWRFAYHQSNVIHVFQAFIADLEGDSNPELVIANQNGISNGLGLRTWTAYIVPEPLTHLPQQSLQFTVEEYGRQGTFVQDGNQFEIWTTEWSEGVIGQQWRYRNGQLRPTKHPILKRWYSFNFEAERNRTYLDPRIPYLWLASSKVQAHSEHPLLKSTAVLSVEDGVIENIVSSCIPSDRPCVITVTFKPNQGGSRSYSYSLRGHQQMSEDEPQLFAYFGDWSSRRIYPRRYLPTDSSTWLNGRTCKLITYQDKAYSEHRFNILWLM